jgi:hypothetical protein
MRVTTLVTYLVACLVAFTALTITLSPSFVSHAPPATTAPSPGPPLSPSPSPTTPEVPYLAEIIPYLPLIGAVGAVWKYAKDWREQVVLGISGITVKTHSYYFGNTHINEPTYCLRVQNRRRKGRGESCEGRINVKGTNIDHSTVWVDYNQREIPISLVADLLLFRVSELNNDREIVFVVASPKDDNYQAEIRKPFSEYANRNISVTIGSANAHVPKPYTKTVGEIIQSAER